MPRNTDISFRSDEQIPSLTPLHVAFASTSSFYSRYRILGLSACDTTAKNYIFFLKDYRRVTKYHLVTIFLAWSRGNPMPTSYSFRLARPHPLFLSSKPPATTNSAARLEVTSRRPFVGSIAMTAASDSLPPSNSPHTTDHRTDRDRDRPETRRGRQPTSNRDPTQILLPPSSRKENGAAAQRRLQDCSSGRKVGLSF